VGKRRKNSGPSAVAPPPPAADRFRRTRAAHASERTEDYVEAIAQLEQEQGEARVGELARMMGVSHVTVSRLVTRLAKDGLVDARPYRPMTLTRNGRQLAAQMAERHRVVLAFLRWLGVPERHAQLDAEGIEHHVSEATISAMRAKAGPG
jgi:DtxR family manganese transport transcriptional regulator